MLGWFTDTGMAAITGDAPQLSPLVEKKAEFLAGLYTTMGYRPAKRFDLSESTAYQLFCRQAGLRVEYVEIMLSRSLDELNQLLAATGWELLRTQLPKRTRFLVVEDTPPTAVAPFADGEIRIVAYDRFVETIVDVPGHLATMLRAYPQPAPGQTSLGADALAAMTITGEATVSGTEDAAEMLRRLAATSANVLVIGGPGSGKTTLLKQLAAAAPDESAHRYRFYLDMSLTQPGESFADFVTRALGPYMACRVTECSMSSSSSS